MRSFNEMARVTSLVALAGFALAGCGSGGSGSADLGQGPTVPTPPPPVTVTETFDFLAPAGDFVVGTPPTHARFSGGVASGNGAWIVPKGKTAVVDFGTPADAVKFSTKDAYTAAAAAAAAAAEKIKLPSASQKVDPPFDVAMYVRGQVRGDWAVLPENQLLEVSDNVLAVTIPIEPGTYNFKIADAGWTGATNCGGSEKGAPVTLGVPFTMGCSNNSVDMGLIITEAGNYKFTLNATGADKGAPTVTVAKDTGGGGGGGGEVPEDSTIIRIFAKDVLTAGSQPTLLKTVKGLGQLDVDELRQGGDTRITRIEIENTGTNGDVGIENFTWTANPRFAPAMVSVDIVYRRPLAGQPAGTTVTIAGKTYDCTPNPDTAFACIVRGVMMYPFANAVMTVTNADGTTESIGFNADNGGSIDDDTGDVVFAISGSPTARNGVPGSDGNFALPQNENEVILFYKRPDNNYTGWGLHLFPLDPPGDAWTKFPTPGEFPFEGIDPQWGAYYRIALPGQENPRYSNNPPAIDTFPAALGFIIHKGDAKDPGPDQVIRIAEDGTMLFVVSGVNDVSQVPPGSGDLLRVAGAAAHWVNSDTLLWTPPNGVTKVELLFSPDASINAGVQGITGTYETITLTAGTNPQPAFNKQLHGLQAWSLPATAVAKAKDLVRGQLVVIGRNADDVAKIGTTVQAAGALDALYAEAAAGAKLGASYDSGTPSLALWAPTALKDPGVSVNVYDAEGTLIETRPMELDSATGVWSVAGDADWDRKFYTYTLRVFSYAANSMVTNEVTDPYSVSLSTDSVHSQFVDLGDSDLKPAGWDNLAVPALAAPEDSVLYELHVRDFSIADTTVPAADRGKFTAFDIPDSNGRNHLEEIAQAGVTHVHILPAFDIATVRENPADQVNIDDPVERLCDKNPAAASLCATDAGKTIRQAMTDAVAANRLDQPAQITEWIRDLDGFNWGYDPLHFGAPEGSYSTNPNGAQRVLEFRRMVKGLNDAGLRTVMDVVYNHTNASGQSSRSVLDRVVPGYYHRRDNVSGNVLKDSCCDDTATEFRMMEKLMVDTGVMWVRDYKVTGFRFDLMSFHTLDAMLHFQDTVKAIDPSVYIYGEGWNFGAIEDDKRFTAARQANMGGTGIGSFSDRVRDPIRGSGPFDSGPAHVQKQGLISGWFYAPNSANTGSPAEREALIADTDNVRVWMAGGLASYRLENAAGQTVPGSEIDYRGQDSGYTKDPQEAINYISKHDNETIWDIAQYKHASGTSLEDRVRADNVGMSIMLLGQGIPFLQAGTEILRSKSMDRNSFDSGDWFNEIDWTLNTSKWNVGLPRAGDNAASYDQIKIVQLDVDAEQDRAAREAASANFKELLAIRKSSPLFRLRTQAQIDQRLKFHNTGPFQIPGVVAMSIEGCTEPGLTPPEGAVMVVVNASDDPRTLGLYTDQAWTLHPVQQASTDPMVRTARHDANGFFVPARTTAVFRRTSQTSCAPYPRDLFVRGGFNSWAADPAFKLQFLGGTDYSVSSPVSTAGDFEFKIADEGWTAGTNCGAVTAGDTVRLGVPLTLDCSSNNNLKLSAASAGNYTFALNAASTANPVLTVTKTPPTPITLFVRGGFNDWGNGPAPTAPLGWDGVNTYRAVISGLTAGTYEFKVADNDWGGTTGGATNCGAVTAGTPVALGTPFTLTCAGSSQNMGVTFPATGGYLFAVNWVNPAAPQLTIEKLPVDVDVFVRGINADWSDGAANRMSYLGGGIFALNKSLAAAEDDFKVASSDWATVNCGSGAAGGTVTVGTPLAVACGDGTGNLSVTPARAGTYTFQYKYVTATAGEVTVSGP